MALIEKEPQIPKKEQLNLRLDPDVSEMLRQYCLFLDSSVHYVLGEVLKLTFRKDREFQTWLSTASIETTVGSRSRTLQDG